MKTTNVLNVPDIMVKAITRDAYDQGDVDYSVTQLIKPPRALQLERRFKEEMEHDVVDYWNMFIGTGVHANIFNALKDDPEFCVEERMYLEYDGVKISGCPDLYEKSAPYTLYDHKTMQTSAFGLEVKPEYEAQLNIYKYMLEKNGHTINRLMLNVVYLDWRKAAVKYADPTKYPAAPGRLVPVPIWTTERVEAFLTERIAMHEAAAKMENDALPECLPEEVWERPSKYAVQRKGALKAMRLLDTAEEAYAYVKQKKLATSDYSIIHRPGARIRCESYCSAAPFCNQYLEWLSSKEENDDNPYSE